MRLESSSPDLIYQAIAHHTRRAILDLLQGGPKGVTEIASKFPISQPAVSQQLKVLLNASLVTADVLGRERIYRINRARLRPVHDWLSRAVADPSGHVWNFRTKPRSTKGE